MFSFDCCRLTLALFFFLLRRLPPRPPTFSLEPVWWCLLRRLPRPMTPYCLGKFGIYILFEFLFSTRVLPGVGCWYCAEQSQLTRTTLSFSLLLFFVFGKQLFSRRGKRALGCVSLTQGEKSRRRRRDSRREGVTSPMEPWKQTSLPFPQAPSFFLSFPVWHAISSSLPTKPMCIYIYFFFTTLHRKPHRGYHIPPTGSASIEEAQQREVVSTFCPKSMRERKKK